MTFLNPIMLFGLAAAAIPILLHLLNLRKLKTVEFSSLRFLKELQRTRIRRIRLRQWILLLLRTLLVLSLVLAFSRPALRGSLASLGGTSARSTIVLLIDDSPSMGMRNAGGMLFDQARAAARRIIGLAHPGDAIHVLPLSAARTDEAGPAALDPQEALRLVDALPLSNRFSLCAPAIGRAVQATRASAAANTEYYLLTDLQATTFAADTSHHDATPDVRLFVVPFPHEHRENAAIATASVESRILAQNRPVTVSTLIRNFGERELPNTVASLYIEGSRVAQQTVSIPAHGGATVELTGVPKRRGILACSVRIEGDALEIDDRRSFAIAIPETLAILLAGDTPAAMRFPSLALSLAGDSSVAGLFRIRQVDAGRLMTADIEATDVLVLCSGKALPAGAGERIASAVRNGMGLMIFPGPATDAADLERTLLQPLGIPPIVMPAVRTATTDESGFVRFGTTDLSHPIFAGMFEQSSAQRTAPSIESPRILSAATLTIGPTGASLIGLTDGRPFLVEYRAGAGRVLLCAVDAGTAWSDFPVHGIYAPLLHRSMVFLAATASTDTGAHIGDRLTLTLPRAAARSNREFIVVAPDGSAERVIPHVQAGSLFFTSSPAEQPGLYTLRDARPTGGAAARGPLQTVAVNPTIEESDLTEATDGVIAACAAAYGIPASAIHTVHGDEGLARSVTEARYGVELWRFFLGLALACAALEMLIARTTRTAAGDETTHA